MASAARKGDATGTRFWTFLGPPHRSVALAVSVPIVAALSAHTLSPLGFFVLCLTLTTAVLPLGLVDSVDQLLEAPSKVGITLRIIVQWLLTLGPAAGGVYLWVTSEVKLPWWSLLAFLVPAASFASVNIYFRKATGPYPAISSFAFLALLGWLHHSQGTLIALRPGTEVLHLVLFVSTWFGTVGLCEISRMRIGPARSWITSGLVLLTGLVVHEVDRRALKGLYPAVHTWLSVSAVVIVVSGVTLLCRRWVQRLPAPLPRRLQLAALCILAMGLAAPWLSARLSPGLRANLAKSPIGNSLVALMPGGFGAAGGAEHPALRYAQHLEAAPSQMGLIILLVSIDGLRGDALKYAPGQMLSERLSAAGYDTRAIPYATGEFFRKGAGFDRGFDEFVDLTLVKWQDPTSEKVTERARTMLREDLATPWFTWIHYYDPHQSGRSKAKYRQMVGIFDRSFGQLMLHLKRTNNYDNTIIAVVADHGEAFGEHGHFGHASSLYEEQVRVPLLLKVPGIPPRRSSVPVAVVDLTATLAVLGGADTSHFDGVNLVAALENEQALLQRPVFTEAHRYLSNKGKRTSDLKAVILGDLKLIIDRNKNTAELFDLSQDPFESQNLVDSRADDYQELSAILSAFIATEERTQSLP